jgi:ABC-type multidrug transport system ATPase subunit
LEIKLENIGKRYNRHWVFKDVSYDFSTGSRSSIVGANGSGKSTLVKIIGGYLSPSAGKISFYLDGKELIREDIFKEVSFCAPYVNVPGDLTLFELLNFHHSLRPLSCTTSEFVEICQLPAHGDKQIRHFSSGMQQRVRLSLALLTQSSLVILDEPSSNLDKRGIAWFQELLNSHSLGKTIIIGSNHNLNETENSPVAIDLGSGAVSE